MCRNRVRLSHYSKVILLKPCFEKCADALIDIHRIRLLVNGIFITNKDMRLIQN